MMGRPKHIPRSPQFFEQLSFHSVPSPATAGRSHRTTDQIVSSLSLGQKGPDALQRAQWYWYHLGKWSVTVLDAHTRSLCHSMSLLLSKQSLPVWKPRLLDIASAHQSLRGSHWRSHYYFHLHLQEIPPTHVRYLQL